MSMKEMDTLLAPASEARLGLTTRQHQVLVLVGQGLQNKKIEDRLGISARTVRAHLTEVFRALEVQTRTQAVLKAHSLGLLQ